MSHVIVLVLLGCPDDYVVSQITSNAIVLQIFGKVSPATEPKPLFHQSCSGKLEFDSIIIKSDKCIFQSILAVIFCYHSMVCVNFLMIRLFVASARSHVEQLHSSLTHESFWEATTCEFCKSTATGRPDVIIFQFMLRRIFRSLSTNFRLSQSKSTASVFSTPPTPSHCSPVRSTSRNRSM